MTEHLTTAIENARQALAAGHTQNAFELGAFILERHPDSLDGIELKAGAEQARGDWRAAEDTLRRAIAVAPHLYTPFQYLAQILQATGRTDEADAVIRETLAIHPTHPDAHGMLGVRLSQTGSLIAANWHLREALRLGPRQAPLVALLGHNLAQLGNNDEAERLLAEAIATEPHVLLPRIDYARTLERSEKFDEARKEMAEAGQMAARLGQDIGFQEALLLEATGEWQSALAKLEATTTPTGGTLLTRGRLKDRAGRYEEAWADFVAGKARQQHDLGKQYDRKGVDTHIARLTEFFSEPRLASLPKARVRHNLPQPIFIMGFPRSGTTMTEQLLTAHARIRAGDELPFAAELAQFAVQILGSYPQGLIELVAADRHHLATLLRDFYFARAETYGLLKPGADFFTDKMPLNELYLPLLRIAFPEAPMIIVRRHPLDILVSVMGHNLTHGFNCGFAAEDTAHHIAAISGLIAHWRDVGIDMLTLRYETFVRDQSAETERLMRYIGLEVEPAQINFHTNRRIAPTPSYAQVREPLYDRSIGRWRHYSEALAAVRPILAETIEREGYEG